MNEASLLASLKGLKVHLVGIKGTGMAALAELLNARGAAVKGSDTYEKFYTDVILDRLGIPYNEGFAAENLKSDTQLVIYSAAYDPAENPELIEASRWSIPIMVYTDALGCLSKMQDSSGIAGVHGKTTTTAIAAVLAKQLKLPASVLIGSAVSSLGDRSTLVQGDKYFIAETCEYKRHFLAFQPARIVITSVQPDHLDYFKDYNDILDAFISYGLKLSEKGCLIYCADDKGASETASIVAERKNDIRLIPYGFNAVGNYRLRDFKIKPGETAFSLAGFKREFAIRIPGKHTVLNAAAAIALIVDILEKEKGEITLEDIESLAAGLSAFDGSRRRSEIIGEAKGIMFMDDYGHHPTAIKTTLEGLKEFYPGRRIIVDFMSHTYSRTYSLLEDFSRSFSAADEVILHKIYASAREKESSLVSGRDLYAAVKRHHPKVTYFNEVMDAFDYCCDMLRPGDLFLTLGAGNNWVLGKKLYRRFSG
ncbi:MAG: UDP-N-acetylmuramate--L-alanine ligase [Spirochaetota bacterium]